ncbi:DUF3291 domain-containing protein [Yinghuangia seranimata]|uniref:DUF3291 domain-containing protein n=1 Tax=Yinghuangia seranimata TaxID=408067 RepID=UPI00248C955D|nr:DUF3291 domain-containing protein [Yinghuangia seranimata]MDI2129150.1 DUF3291 domain-containing protein [Yinghuangia seranimata]
MTPMPNTPAPTHPSGHHLAQLNIARLRAPVDSPQLADFVAALPEMNALAESSPGFVWRLQEDPDDPHATVTPAAFGPEYIFTMSVWEDADSLWDYVYRSGHLDFLRRRQDWFAEVGERSQVLWWIPAGHLPTEHEGAERLTHLREHGPGPEAFTFRQRYPAPDAAPATAHATAQAS